MLGLAAATESITFDAPPAQVIAGIPPGGPGAVNGGLAATATSGLAVNFTSLTPTVCTVSGSTVYGVSAGTCSISANQPGGVSSDRVYGAAPQVTQSFAVTGMTASTQKITFGAAAVNVIAGTPPGGSGSVNGALTATATSGLAVTFNSLTPTICFVSGGAVYGVSAGTCTVAANQPGGIVSPGDTASPEIVYSPAPQVTQSFPISGLTAATQSITFSAAPTNVTAGSPPGGPGSIQGYVSATATSGLGVVYASLTPTVCSIYSTTIYGLSAGTCTISANQPGGIVGTVVYATAPQVTQSFPVGGLGAASQTITFGAPPAGVVAVSPPGTTGAVNGSLVAGASSGLTVTFASLTPAVCYVSGTTVIGVSAGTCNIAADQPGGLYGEVVYGAAPQVTQSFAVTGVAPTGLATQTITFGSAPTGAVFTPIAQGTGSVNATVSATASSGARTRLQFADAGGLRDRQCLQLGRDVLHHRRGTVGRYLHDRREPARRCRRQHGLWLRAAGDAELPVRRARSATQTIAFGAAPSAHGRHHRRRYRQRPRSGDGHRDLGSVHYVHVADAGGLHDHAAIRIFGLR